MEPIDPIPGKFPVQQIDPKDEVIEILQAHIKDLQNYNEFLKGQLELLQTRKVSDAIPARRKLNTASEIKQALEAHSRMIAQQKHDQAEAERAQGQP